MHDVEEVEEVRTRPPVVQVLEPEVKLVRMSGQRRERQAMCFRPESYDEYAAAALRHSQRPEVDAEVIVDSFEAEMARLAGHHVPCGRSL